jgi:hypothetical protein
VSELKANLKEKTESAEEMEKANALLAVCIFF